MAVAQEEPRSERERKRVSIQIVWICLDLFEFISLFSGIFGMFFDPCSQRNGQPRGKELSEIVRGHLLVEWAASVNSRCSDTSVEEWADAINRCKLYVYE